MPPQTLVHGQPTRPGHVFSLKRGRQASNTSRPRKRPISWLVDGQFVHQKCFSCTKCGSTGRSYTRRAFRVRNAVRRAVRTPEGLYVYGTESVSPPQKLGSRPGGPKRLQARAVREERCDDREAPGEAKLRRHAPGGSCEAAGVRGKALRMQCHLHKTKNPPRKAVFLFCGDKEIRTPDPLLAKQVLYQLSYTPIIGAMPPQTPAPFLPFPTFATQKSRARAVCWCRLFIGAMPPQTPAPFSPFPTFALAKVTGPGGLLMQTINLINSGG